MHSWPKTMILLLLPGLFLTGCSDPLSFPAPGSDPGDNPDWEEMLGQPVLSRGVWVAGNQDIFVLGGNGHIVHFDGTRWSLTDPQINLGMFGIWGFSPDNVVLVGFKGDIHRYNGSVWTKESSGTEEGLRGVWGRSATEIYAVGDHGTIIHYNGSGWQSMNSGTDRNLLGVSGSDDGHLYAVGSGGVILHRAPGGNWVLEREESFTTLRGVWVSGNRVVAVGEAAVGNPVALFFDGNDWIRQEDNITGSLEAVFGFSDTDIWAVGSSGSFHYDGNQWQPGPGGKKMTGVHGAEDGTLVLLNERETAHVRSDMVWNIRQTGITGLGITSIWGSSDDDILFVGPFYEAMRYDGNAWTALQDVPPGLREVWGRPGGQEVFAVSSDSRIHLLEGETFSEFHAVSAGNVLISIWGDEDQLFAGGRYGFVTHFDGSGWSETNLEVPGRNTYVQDITGIDGEHVYAVVVDGVYRFDGIEWTPILELEDTWFLKGIAAVAPDEIYVLGTVEVGSSGFSTEILHYNGETWTPVIETSRNSLNEIMTSPDGTVAAVGTRFGSVPAVVFRGKRDAWSYETIETGRVGGWDTGWISPSGRLHMTNGAVWRARDTGETAARGTHPSR